MSTKALNMIAICVPVDGAHEHDRKENKMSSKTTLTAESVAAVSKQMGCSIEGMNAAHAFKLEGKPLFQIFRGSDRDRPDSTSGKPYTPDQVEHWPTGPGMLPTEKRQSSPFKSADADKDTAPKKRRPLTDDQKRIAKVMGVDEETLAERLDTLDESEEQVTGVDGLPRKTRVRAPHSVLVRDLVA